MTDALVDAVRREATSQRVAQLLGVKLKADGTGCCPLHEDANPSFKAYPDGGGWKCFACHKAGGNGISLWQARQGGDFLDAVRSLAARLGIPADLSPGGNGSRPGRAQAARKPAPAAPPSKAHPWAPCPEPPANLAHPTHGRPACVFHLSDGAGRLCAVHLRFETPEGKRDKAKGMPWWRCGKWKLGIPLSDVPFFLSERVADYDAAGLLVITEGENCARVLAEFGVQALGTLGTSQKDPSEPVLAVLDGWRGPVLLFADNDDGGRVHMERLAATLTARGLRVAIYQDSTLPIGGDAVEWLAARPGRRSAGELAAELSAVADRFAVEPEPGPPADLTRPATLAETLESPEPEADVEPAPEPDPWPAYELFDFLALPREPRRWVVEGFIQEKDLVMVHAARGCGKSFLTQWLAFYVAAGLDFLRWRIPEPVGVLYVDGELPQEETAQRLAAVVHSHEISDLPAPLVVLCADACDRPLPSLATPEGQAVIEAKLAAHPGIKLIILDSITTLCGTDLSENDAASWDVIQEWLLSLRRRGYSVLLVHHSNKTGGQRGTSKREDVLSQVLNLKPATGAEEDTGARFIVELTKKRGVYGALAQPFEASLTQGPDGRQVWTYRMLAGVERDPEILERLRLGLSYADIAQELGNTSKTAVARAAKRLKDTGEWTGKKS